MCRIAGIVSQQSGIDEIRKKVIVMCNALKHGGPDDEGIFCAENANLVFGHRRLSIIDLSNTGHQPMADIHQKAWITFNGEIYNYLSLKEQLVKIGAKFYSNSDTEVIIQAYLHWGIAAFSKFRGMFAFALYDIEKAITYLVRDEMGIKPLYYHIENGQLSFASEVKAIKLAGIATKEDKTWLVKFLAFGHIPEPGTTLKNVFSLQKGHVLCWDNNNSTYHVSRYSKPVATTYITDTGIAESKIKDQLSAAIERQLIADAPIGVFLSGGTDSSLIALLANQHKQHQLKTVSLFFDEKDYDERIYQQQIFDKLQGEKFTHLIKQEDFEEFFPDIINAMDMPTTDGINSWFISKYAHQDGLKSVLSGLGADEIFGGYPSFNRVRYIEYLKNIPSALLKTVNYFSPDRFKKLAFLSNDHVLADYLFLRGLFDPGNIAKILNCDEKEVCEILFAADNTPDPGLADEERAAWFETNLYMQNQLLHDTDIMSMSNGLEVRVPFLDEDLQHTVNNISPGIRFNKKQPKKLLTDTFKDILPLSIWDRPKMGFTFPLQQWMKQHAEISNENLYKNPKAKSIIKKFKNGKVHWSKAFALYQVQKHV